MNKSAIQRFAIWARTELISQVSQRAYQYDITKDGYGDPNALTVGGRALTPNEQRQRRELVKQIQRKNYTQVMEEVAYTWFNRFIALRFMEVNNYLPSHIRVFSDSTGAFKPEILTNALHLELDGLNPAKVAEYIENNQTDDLYRYLLLTQCNALNTALPRMFERMGGYTELLLPNNILKQDGILGRMVTDIPEADWTDQVQIIGWLYQYYNSELKDDTFALLKKNVKITKERIPSATQLFTPDWIVRYMVENSLGRLWIEHLEALKVFDFSDLNFSNFSFGESGTGDISNQQQELKDKWKYYLDEAEQEPEVKGQLAEIRRGYKDSKPEDIKIIDPCMGSGHILVYAFDVLMDIYRHSGWNDRDAACSILQNNLYGLDIDDRAAQLAYFAVMMKARQYDRRFFTRGIQPHVYVIVESNGLDNSTVSYFTNNNPNLQRDFALLREQLRDAKEYGSILNISQVDFAALYARVDEICDDFSMFREMVLSSILPLLQVAETMAQKYDVVVTNPPYMGGSGMSTKLSEFVKKNYPDSKSDLFAVFIERCGQMTRKNGYQAMITQHAWMFLSSYEKLRAKLLSVDIVNMVHLGARAFEEIGGEVVQTTSFVMRKSHIANYKGEYCRLIEPTTQQGKETMFLAGENRYAADQSNFSKIPGSPIAYWVSEKVLECYKNSSIYDYAKPCKGIDTGDNNVFLRLWHEISDAKQYLPKGIPCCDDDFLHLKWFPYNKGGNYRRWYGNNEYVLNWEENGSKLRQFKGSNLRNKDRYFEQGITWSTVTSGNSSFRFFTFGFLFDNGGSCLFADNHLLYIQGLLNSCVSQELLSIQPTLNNQPGTIGSIPLLLSLSETTINDFVNQNIAISKGDWDAYETSWDFKRNPLV